MAEHRGSLLSAPLRRFEDPAKSRDPRVRALVSQLTALDPAQLAPAPRAHFRAELRAQLVAVAPRVVAESAEARPTESARRSRGWLPRPVAAVAAALAVLLVLGGGAVWWSQRAVPGDVLYGLKRASESVRLALASSDTARAGDYLEFAGRRVDEAKALVATQTPSATGAVAASRLSPHTASEVRSSLGSADSDVRSATQLLGAQAMRSHSAGPLSQLRSWAPSQLQRLHELAAMLPRSPLQVRTLASADLVHDAEVRAAALGKDLRCGCLGRSTSDQLGPRPCASCAPAPGAGGAHRTQPARGSSGIHRGGIVGGSRSPSARGSQSRPGGAASSGGVPGGVKTSVPGPLPSPSLPLPSLPVHLPTASGASHPSVPASVGSCGISAGLLGVSLSAGTCTAHG